jgi:SPP1 family phage portal protein
VVVYTSADATSTTCFTNSPLNYGRQRIVLNYDKVTPDNFLEVFDKAKAIHQSNKNDCEYLIGMFLGKQNILNRPNPNTSNINNKTVVNYAFPISRQVVGYTLGNPIELVPRDSKKSDDIQELSDILNYLGIYAVDICAALYSSICGIGYEITLPSSGINSDFVPDIPITVDYLDPRYTFTVCSTDVGNPQIMSCMELTDSDGKCIKYVAFTNDYKFTLDCSTDDRKVHIESNPIGLDPIVPWENSLFLTGDWEQAISVMDAINQVTSDSLNDIEGTIKSLLVLIGCEIDDSEETLKSIKEKRLLSIAGGTEAVSGNLDAKFISPKLESTSVKNIREFLEDARNVITGIPDRSANSSGGDTGEAVLNRDGWTDLEIVAKLKELFIKKAKSKQIAVAMKILKNVDKLPSDLEVTDVVPSIGRHTTDNLGTKTTAFSTLVATGELATIDCLEMSGLTTRVNEVVERGKKEKEERMKENQEMISNGHNYNHAYISTVDKSNSDDNSKSSNMKIPEPVSKVGNSGGQE